MADSTITVREVFDLPERGTTEEATKGWNTFEDRVRQEVKTIKTAAMPDLASKVAELLEIPIPQIFLTSWKKSGALQELLAESKKTPETIMSIELGEHTVNSQHRPHIEVRIQKASVKKLEFVLRLVFKLKGFVLKVQDGAIKEMQAGSCELRGTLEHQGLTIAEKKLAPVNLPGSIRLERNSVAQTKGSPGTEVEKEVIAESGKPAAPVDSVATREAQLPEETGSSQIETVTEAPRNEQVAPPVGDPVKTPAGSEPAADEPVTEEAPVPPASEDITTPRAEVTEREELVL